MQGYDYGNYMHLTSEPVRAGEPRQGKDWGCVVEQEGLRWAANPESGQNGAVGGTK